MHQILFPASLRSFARLPVRPSLRWSLTLSNCSEDSARQTDKKRTSVSRSRFSP